MTVFALTGLRPNNPVAVMAAYGALRLLPGARLRWAGAYPELDFDGDPVSTLADLLPLRRKSPEVTLLDDPRKFKDRDTLRDVIRQLSSDWQLVLASEGADQIDSTDLLLMGGRHQFVANAREIMDILARQNVVSKLTEALVGPWRYEDKNLQAWGWDAGSSIDTAASSKAGTATPKYGVSAAAWLAWESLPLWPLVNGGTWGWVRREGFCYLTAAEWMDWHALRALTLGDVSIGDADRHALGVRRWLAPQIRTSQYGSVLGWSRETARTPTGRRRQRGSRIP